MSSELRAEVRVWEVLDTEWYWRVEFCRSGDVLSSSLEGLESPTKKAAQDAARAELAAIGFKGRVVMKRGV